MNHFLNMKNIILNFVANSKFFVLFRFTSSQVTLSRKSTQFKLKSEIPIVEFQAVFSRLSKMLTACFLSSNSANWDVCSKMWVLETSLLSEGYL